MSEDQRAECIRRSNGLSNRQDRPEGAKQRLSGKCVTQARERPSGRGPSVLGGWSPARTLCKQAIVHSGAGTLEGVGCQQVASSRTLRQLTRPHSVSRRTIDDLGRCGALLVGSGARGRGGIRSHRRGQDAGPSPRRRSWPLCRYWYVEGHDDGA